MPLVSLRPVRSTDLAVLSELHDARNDLWNFFGFRSAVGLENRFAKDGFVGESDGVLAVEDQRGDLVGQVSWHEVRHGPTSACRAMNIGIVLLPEHRGQGYGGVAQSALADHFFKTTTIERVEAGTDTENRAEQRALEKAGFHREGVLRHAQFRGGEWRDQIMFSRLRCDPSSVSSIGQRDD
jgi:RimJ/RimL family protein N-acetyltransferase